ncbi:hypothetical protein [Enterococcus gilvus]|uniref:hypothetical protein n=1 Tax=Enterococcus gilvus TaxID=160453 RepID=UPI0005D1BF0B|nr:hypothetical protein [Enterococcus gilvus]
MPLIIQLNAPIEDLPNFFKAIILVKLRKVELTSLFVVMKDFLKKSLVRMPLIIQLVVFVELAFFFLKQ